MSAKVDEGPILAVERFPLPSQCGPHELRILATEALFSLFAKSLPLDQLRENKSESWAAEKTTRRQLLSMCNLAGLSSTEVARRRRAFDGFPFHF